MTDFVISKFEVGRPTLRAPKLTQHHVLSAHDLEVQGPFIGHAVYHHAITPVTSVYAQAGSELLFKAATGFEKAIADTDAERQIAIYAEAVKDVWNPYAISYENLPYLAWAMGVTLWEDWWSEDIKRWWTDKQWSFKALRGKEAGLDMGIRVMGGKLRRVIAPPAKSFSLPAFTEADRAAYVARFPQLRLYPYVARVKLKYMCFTRQNTATLIRDDIGDIVGADEHHPPRQRNGAYTTANTATLTYDAEGEITGAVDLDMTRRRFFPTSQNAGGRYTRTAAYWDRGVETILTFRRIVPDKTAEDVRQYDEVILPARKGSKYFTGEPKKFLRPPRMTKCGIFLGVFDPVAERTIRIPRDGSLELSQAKAIYQTILPSLELIDLYPKHTTQEHFTSRFSTFVGNGYLCQKFLPPSKAWQFLWETWYVFDRDRVLDARKRSVFMGNTRLGIHKYTAEAHVEAYGKVPLMYRHRFMHGYMRPKQTVMLDRVRKGTRASMALRDTVLLKTAIKRTLRVADTIQADGKHYVGQLVE